MGGNLFKVGRVSKDRYNEILRSLRPILDRHFRLKEAGEELVCFYRIPIAYFDKADYGDVDIIVNKKYLQDRDWVAPLIKDMGVTEVKKVRNVVSTLYQDFQVDFFTVADGNFESTYQFMCYNVLGNLLGRMFHKFNLKYGEDGLKYVLRGYNDTVSREISLTKDVVKALEFLELDPANWKYGFSNRKEIFDYVINCKYFCSSSYSDEYFNVRKRASQRPDFNAFLDYLKWKNIDKNYPFVKEKEVYIPMIEAFFPESNLMERYLKHMEKQQILEQVAEKFNGRIVMTLLGYKDAQLGRFLDTVKSFYGDKFNSMVIALSQEQVNHLIIRFNDEYFIH